MQACYVIEIVSHVSNASFGSLFTNIILNFFSIFSSQECDVTITADDGNIIVFSMLYASLNFYRSEYNDLLEIYEGKGPHSFQLKLLYFVWSKGGHNIIINNSKLLFLYDFIH